jgi:hypothetical protein
MKNIIGHTWATAEWEPFNNKDSVLSVSTQQEAVQA